MSECIDVFEPLPPMAPGAISFPPFPEAFQERSREREPLEWADPAILLLHRQEEYFADPY